MCNACYENRRNACPHKLRIAKHAWKIKHAWTILSFFLSLSLLFFFTVMQSHVSTTINPCKGEEKKKKNGQTSLWKERRVLRRAEYRTKIIGNNRWNEIIFIYMYRMIWPIFWNVEEHRWNYIKIIQRIHETIASNLQQTMATNLRSTVYILSVTSNTTHHRLRNRV